MNNLDSILQNLKKLDDIKGILVVDERGAISETIVLTDLKMEELLGLAISCQGASNKASEFLKYGTVNQNYVEYKDLNITIESLSNGSSLMVVAASGKNLGRIRYEIKRSKALLEENKPT